MFVNGFFYTGCEGDKWDNYPPDVQRFWILELNVCFFGDGSEDDYIMAIAEFYQLDNDWWDWD